MIPRHELIAWRAHADWRTDAQVEQDYLLTRTMVAIFSDPFLASQTAMRGGTVLHKVHLAPATRYSEDIDLVLVGDRPVEHVKRALRRVLEPVLGQPVVDVFGTVQLAVRNVIQPSRVARLIYTYRPTIAPPQWMKIKVEINFSERDPFYAIVPLPYQPPLPGITTPVVLRSYDLDEMLGTKMRALLQRTQGRDLFDLHHALVRHEAALAANAPAQVDPQRVVNAFLAYMRRERTVVTRDSFERVLDRKLSRRDFQADMNTVLPPHTNYDVTAAAEAVRTAIIAKLPPA